MPPSNPFPCKVAIRGSAIHNFRRKIVQFARDCILSRAKPISRKYSAFIVGGGGRRGHSRAAKLPGRTEKKNGGAKKHAHILRSELREGERERGGRRMVRPSDTGNGAAAHGPRPTGGEVTHTTEVTAGPRRGRRGRRRVVPVGSRPELSGV